MQARSTVFNGDWPKDRRERDTSLLSFGLGMAKFPVLCHAKKKTASDTAYLSDSLQGELLHEVNFVSFFQMFVLQN